MADTNSGTTGNTAAETPTADTIIEQAEGLFEQAKEAITDAFEATVDAVKEHPVAAAAIAGGAAAAVAGAVFGATKLAGAKEEPKASPKKH